MPDIFVANYGSIVLLCPGSIAGRAWLGENCDRSGYQPFTGGTVLWEPRYVSRPSWPARLMPLAPGVGGGARPRADVGTRRRRPSSGRHEARSGDGRTGAPFILTFALSFGRRATSLRSR